MRGFSGFLMTRVIRRSWQRYSGVTLCLFLLASCNLLLGNEEGYLVPGVGGEGNGAASGSVDPGPHGGGSLGSGGTDGTGGESEGGTAGAGASSGSGDAGAAGAAGNESGTGCAALSPECIANATATENGACGNCNTGQRTRTRTCSTQCAWGAWGAWGACTGATTACTAGQVETQSQVCGACNKGKQTRSRTCSAQCAWGAWSGWGACGNVTAECLPEPYGPGYRCCGSGKWEWCYESSCTWTDNCAACSDPSACPC